MVSLSEGRRSLSYKEVGMVKMEFGLKKALLFKVIHSSINRTRVGKLFLRFFSKEQRFIILIKMRKIKNIFKTLS